MCPKAVKGEVMADPNRKKYEVIGNVEIDRVLYTEGDEVELDKERGDAAVEAGNLKPVNKSSKGDK